MSLPVRVTYRDIAARTGYDKSTVSLALRGSPRIAAETRRLIQAAAAELGYRPDPLVAALARQRWLRGESGGGAAIAYLVERRKGNFWLQHRHFATAQERAQERGYQLTEFDLSDYPSGGAASRALYHRGIRGLLLPSMPHEANDHIHGFDWERFTVVCCSLGWLRTPFHVVTSNMFEGTRRAWQEVAARGYRRIGAALFRHAPVAIDDPARLGASFAEQSMLDASHTRLPFLLCHPDDRQSFLDWFDQHRPDAVIGLIPGVGQWIRDAGYRIPEDVGFVTLHAFQGEPDAGLYVERETVARAAIDLLISQMHDNQWAVPTIQQLVHLTPRWIEGNSLRPRVSPSVPPEDWRGELARAATGAAASRPEPNG